MGTKAHQPKRAHPVKDIDVPADRMKVPNGEKSIAKRVQTEEECKKLGLRRVVRLAVNVFDLNQVPPIVLKNVLTDPETNEWRITKDRPIVVQWDKPDEQCAEFTCGLLTAALCLDVLRNEMRHNGSTYSVRAYICTSTDPVTKKPIWKRFKHNDVLTVKDGKKIGLNPECFPMIENLEPLTPPTTGFVFRGRKK